MDMKAMLKQAQKMQADLEKKQSELAKKEFNISKQGVEIVINGAKEITKLVIHPALIDEDDKETLEDLLILAFNEAISLISEEEAKIAPKANSLGF
ncbi:YbaB/EbfC family nucleoid-associated protein [[Mycoplasma] mobile]|uniref:Nucleoid-associated protein MMOB0740 n=1 Tax=Mycoplasma mobile (strain ATCC 43663 / 163K / NCTC 11711) TaxID=267748 RepID=Y740_MYCM1|nr:YbaB/EbfC family nucleoid-associated protein [[Mycoplasma] mobile]Q6KIL6.1 RecName: Full=Nucleoid-associated protein MMOB0740 [Mycoplasma mobile 163K]AAT27560.1 putative DNA repair-related protein [Mycoplasma mobile 163K]